MEFTISPLFWQAYSEKTFFAETINGQFTIGIDKTILGDIVTLRHTAKEGVEQQYRTIEDAKEQAQYNHEQYVQAFLTPSTAKETVLRDIRTLIDSLMLPGDEPANKSML